MSITLFDECLAFVIKSKPDYKYNDTDFCIGEVNGKEFIICWNFKDLTQPTDEELDTITDQEIDDYKNLDSTKFDLNPTEYLLSVVKDLLARIEVLESK